MNSRDLRKNCLQSRNKLFPAERRDKSSAITRYFLADRLIQEAEHIFSYIHFRSEVETLEMVHKLLQSGITVSVPVTLQEESRLLAVQITDPDSQLAPGCYGIPEPTSQQVARATVDPTTIDTVIVPGSVFDLNGGRMGYGGGYYDRFLSRSTPTATRIGFCYQSQMVDRVPMQPHDEYMDFVITEQGIYKCERIKCVGE